MSSKIFKDPLGRTHYLAQAPQRIVSLVPSQTELLFDLGLDTRVVGLTKFCIHPMSWFREKARIGGTKTVNLAAVRALKPDLILANKEENTREDIEALAAEFPVWMSDIYTLDDALQMIRRVGQLTASSPRAEILAHAIEDSFSGLSLEEKPLRVAYFIWRKPYMIAARDTFIDDLLRRAGWVNAFADAVRYPSISAEDLRAVRPDVVFLSSEPFPFSERHVEEIKDICPNVAVRIVDGELFSWYGSRLQKSAAYFKKLHKDLIEAFKRP